MSYLDANTRFPRRVAITDQNGAEWGFTRLSVENPNGSVAGTAGDIALGSTGLVWLSEGGTAWATLGGDAPNPAGLITVAASGGDFQTITEAVNAAVAGQVVLVYPGDYPESNVPTKAQVRVVGFPAAQNIRIIGADATSTRVNLVPGATLRELTVVGPSAGANPAIDATGLTAPTDLAVLFTVVMVGGGGTGDAVTVGTDGVLFINDVFHNGGTFGGNFIRTQGTGVVVAGGFANVGTIGGAYFFAEGGLVQFDVPYTVRPAVVAAEAVRLGTGGQVEGFIRLDTGNQVTTALRISGDAVSINMVGSVLIAQTNDLVIDPALTGVGSSIVLNACELRQERVVNESPAYFGNTDLNIVAYVDPGGIDDPSFQVGGEFEVGSPFAPAESSLGEGDSTAQNMVVFTDDGSGTNFVDITAALASRTGSTAALLQGTGVGNVVYIGNTLRRFPGLKPGTTTPLVRGAGTLQCAYSTGGGGFTDTLVMAREDSGVGTSFGQTPFEQDSATVPNKINLGDIAELDPALWVQDTINGVTAFWIRFTVITGALTTVPVLERLKLQTNSTEVDNTGIQRHGSNRPIKPLLVHQSLTDDLSGANPGNGSLDIGPDLALTPRDNQFANSVDDGTGGIVQISRGVDTSSPVVFRIGWIPTNNTAGDVKLNLLIAEDIRVGTDIDSGTVPVVTYDAPTTQQPSGGTVVGGRPIVESNTQGQLYITEYKVGIPDAVPGRFFSYALRRDDGSPPNDTYGGAIKIAFIFAESRAWQS